MCFRLPSNLKKTAVFVCLQLLVSMNGHCQQRIDRIDFCDLPFESMLPQSDLSLHWFRAAGIEKTEDFKNGFYICVDSGALIEVTSSKRAFEVLLYPCERDRG